MDRKATGADPFGGACCFCLQIIQLFAECIHCARGLRLMEEGNARRICCENTYGQCQCGKGRCESCEEFLHGFGFSFVCCILALKRANAAEKMPREKLNIYVLSCVANKTRATITTGITYAYTQHILLNRLRSVLINGLLG